MLTEKKKDIFLRLQGFIYQNTCYDCELNFLTEMLIELTVDKRIERVDIKYLDPVDFNKKGLTALDDTVSWKSK